MRWLRNLLLVLLCAAGVSAQEPEVCKPWSAIRPPAADLPAPAYVRQAAHCDVLALYYDAKDADHLKRARWCAFAQVGAVQDAGPANDEAAGDPVANLMLAMLYGNGEGVPKNVPVAKHYACRAEDWFGPDETLKALDAGGGFAECDVDGGRGRVVNFACINLRQEQVSRALQSQLPKTRAALPPQLRPGFDELVAAHDRFRKAGLAEEPNGTSGAVQSGMSNEVNLDREWLAELEAIATGRNLAGKTPASVLAPADRELNTNFRVNLESACAESFCTSREQVRAAARAWLAYREAWVRFGTARWKDSSPDAWRAWATRLRNLQQNGELREAVDSVR